MRLLLLGGTGEARALAARLHPGVDIVSSLAGRVPDPALPVGPVRIGGFGGIEGLRNWLRDNDIAAVVDARAADRRRQDRLDLENAEQAIRNMGVEGMVDAASIAAAFADAAPRPTAAENAMGDRTWTFGHIVVDEAQELSPMQWRLLVRKNPLTSFTRVGDVAQVESAAGASNWASMLTPVFRDSWRLEELTVNYRTPALVSEVAESMAIEAGVPVTPPRAVRTGEAGRHRPHRSRRPARSRRRRGRPRARRWFGHDRRDRRRWRRGCGARRTAGSDSRRGRPRGDGSSPCRCGPYPRRGEGARVRRRGGGRADRHRRVGAARCRRALRRDDQAHPATRGRRRVGAAGGDRSGYRARRGRLARLTAHPPSARVPDSARLLRLP